MSQVLPAVDAGLVPFVDRVSADWRRFPSFDTLNPPARRRVAEEVRKPWRAGGPVMASTEELQVPGRNGSIRIRVHRPVPEVSLPAIVYLHGGGWTMFSIDTHDRLMREYAWRAGMMVIGVDYSLAPEVRFPHAIHETVAVVRWLADHGAALGCDTRSLVLAGDSAGANLAVAATLMLRDAGERELTRALVLNYGAFDADATRPSYQRFGDGRFLLTTSEMQEMWAGYLRASADANDPLACPLRADLEGLPPTHLTIAECDILHDENIAFAERLRSAGVEVEAIVYRGAVHSFLEAVSIASVSGQALTHAAAWLRSIMQRHLR